MHAYFSFRYTGRPGSLLKESFLVFHPLNLVHLFFVIFLTSCATSQKLTGQVFSRAGPALWLAPFSHNSIFKGGRSAHALDTTCDIVISGGTVLYTYCNCFHDYLNDRKSPATNIEVPITNNHVADLDQFPLSNRLKSNISYRKAA